MRLRARPTRRDRRGRRADGAPRGESCGGGGEAPYGLPDLGALWARPPAQRDLVVSDRETADAEPHLHTTYQSVTRRFPVPVDRSRFEGFLSKLDPKQVVRAKGFVRFTGQPGKLFLFQTVWGHHVIDESGAAHPDTVAVLIGPKLDPEVYRTRLRTLVFGGSPGFSVTATSESRS